MFVTIIKIFYEEEDLIEVYINLIQLKLLQCIEHQEKMR